MRRYDPEKHHRRSIRLKGYDYRRPGAYYVTINAQNKACLFGEVVDGEMRLNDAGRVAEECWRAIPDHFPHVELDAFVIMPNHIHGIVWIVDDAFVGAKNVSPEPNTGNTGAKNVSPEPNTGNTGAKDFSPRRGMPRAASRATVFRSPSKTVGSIVRGFKIGVTKWIRANTDIHDVWQRNYYEHIVRDDDDLNRIRLYIAGNPARWDEDSENPGRLSGTDTDA